MIIDKLELHNFGVYAGKHSLEMRPTRGKPIILIGALNGSGKTTLLEAIQLALYGRAAKFLQDKKGGYSRYLEESISRQRGIDSASISISFLSVDTKDDYVVTRTWSSRDAPVSDSVRVVRNGLYDSDLSTRWSEYVDTFLPSALSDLFFFDGEKVESLAEPKRCSEIIADGLNALLGLDLVRDLEKSMLVLKKRLAQEQLTGSAHNTLEQINKELKSLDAAIASISESLQTLNSQLASTQEDIERLNYDYKRNGGDLYDKREELVSKRDLCKLELDSIRQEILRVAESDLPLAQVVHQLKEIAEIQRVSITAEQLKNLENGLVLFSEVLAREVGSKLHIDVQALDFFKELANEVRVSQLSSLKTSALPTDYEEVNRTVEAIHQLKSTSNVTVTRFDIKRSELEDLERQLAAVPAEEKVREIQDLLQKNESEFNNLMKAIERKNDDMARLRREQAIIEKKVEDLHAEARAEIAQSSMLNKINVALTKGSNALEIFGKTLRTKQLEKLEGLVLDGFQQLLRKHRFVHSLKIDKLSHAVSVTTDNDNEMPAQKLSAGERQLLAVAVLWALARLSGRVLPTVIDTPLGRLDSIHRSRLVEHYFPYAGEQVILLSTDEEIVGPYYESLKGLISHVYTLDFDESARVSTIRSGYFTNLKEAA
jgi:DNA sulfur modification protein DndD